MEDKKLKVVLSLKLEEEEKRLIYEGIIEKEEMQDVVYEMSYDACDCEEGYYIVEITYAGKSKEISFKCNHTYLLHNSNIDIKELINNTFLKTYGFNYSVFEKYQDNYSLDAQEAIDNLYYDMQDKIREEEENTICKMLREKAEELLQDN